MGEISCNFPIRMKNGKACFIFINFPNYCDICGWCTNQMKTYQMTTTAKHVLFHKSRSSLVIFCQSDVYIYWLNLLSYTLDWPWKILQLNSRKGEKKEKGEGTETLSRIAKVKPSSLSFLWIRLSLSGPTQLQLAGTKDNAGETGWLKTNIDLNKWDSNCVF